MSRIGKKPINIPAGVDVKVAGPIVSVKGPLGKIDWSLSSGPGGFDCRWTAGGKPIK